MSNSESVKTSVFPKEELENQEVKTTLSPQEAFITNHRIPNSPSSPIASFLSAMPPPLPVYPVTTTSSPGNASTSTILSSLPSTPGTLPLTTAIASNSSSSSSSSVLATAPSFQPVTATPSSVESRSLGSSSLDSNNPTSSPYIDSFSSSSSPLPHLEAPLVSLTASPSPPVTSTLSFPAVPDSSTSPINIPSLSNPSTSPPPPPTTTSSFLPLAADSSSTLSSGIDTSQAPSASVHPRTSIPHNSHKKLIRRAVGMAALNSLALAKAMPLESEEENPLGNSLLLDPVSRALSTNVFGFETILTALVYLSFGIFLYQMIQRAVGAQLVGLPFASAGVRSNYVEEPIETYFAALLQAIEQVPNTASEMILGGGKALEVKEKAPACLPLYLCRLNSISHHQHHLGNSTFTSKYRSFSAHPHAVFTSALSTLVSLWSGQDPSGLLLATWTGALGLPCLSEETICSGKPDVSSQFLPPNTSQRNPLLQAKQNTYLQVSKRDILDNKRSHDFIDS